MRRGPGIAGLQHAARAREQFKLTGEDVKKSSLQAMKDQMAVFKASLEEFAHKYKKSIRQDPAFRAQFHVMCANIGVDPLASNKGMWAEVLGFGDFYYELGVQVVEACLATRSINGGMMELPALLRYVNRRRGSQADPISEDDVARAIKKLQVLGGGFGLVAVGRQQLVRSVPGELNMDKNKVLELAQEAGFIAQRQLIARSGWTANRAEAALQGLLREGLAWLDTGAPDNVPLYWFPCLSNGLQPP